MTAPLWSTTTNDGALTVSLEDAPGAGLALVIDRDQTNPHRPALIFDEAEARAMYEALLLWFEQRATDACPWDHHPRSHRDGKPPWCDYCGKTTDGVQVVDLPGLRGRS